MNPIKIIQSPAVAIAAALVLASMSAQAYQGMATPKLHISGRNLQDPNGKNVRLFGYMLPTDGAGSGGLFQNPTTFSPQECAPILDVWKKEAELLTHTGPLFGKSHGWYNSFIRIWTPSDGWRDDGTVDTALQDRAWNNLYIPYVQYCKSVGLYVVFVGNCPSGPQFMSAQHKSNMIRFWTRICNTYPAIKSADNVMFEICNEPVVIETQLGNGIWQSDTVAADQAMQTYMTDICNAIRATGADNIIWVPGLIWQGRLKNFATNPVNVSNVGYAGHWYPNGEDNPQNLINRWNSDWKFCSDRFPVIVTEGSWNTMASDQGLRRGTSVGFANTMRGLFDTAGNVSWYCGMLGEVIGNLSAGTNNWTLSDIACAQAGFEWWPTYTADAPTGSAQYSGGVTFYQDNNYAGTAVKLAADNYTQAQLVAVGVANDWVSSARVPGGWTVTMYANDNFAGTSWTLSSDTPNFGALSPSANDQMSSCRITAGSGQVANGTYRIIARHSGKAMDASGNGTANGTQIIQWTYGGGNNQRWTVTDRGGGQYSIIGVQSGRCVEVSNWGTANGTKVQLWDYLAGTNQKHTFTATSGGYYRITPTHATGSCLDVSGVSTADGALVQLWQWLNGNNQQWALQAP